MEGVAGDGAGRGVSRRRRQSLLPALFAKHKREVEQNPTALLHALDSGLQSQGACAKKWLKKWRPGVQESRREGDVGGRSLACGCECIPTS